mmetsp:Transcript_84007/g.125923  ORF Transcript_84007/g.125923 Transcript_84007/m.125923 type:complete len:283 (+) Transcript_84007:115-963(+)
MLCHPWMLHGSFGRQSSSWIPLQKRFDKILCLVAHFHVDFLFFQRKDTPADLGQDFFVVLALKGWASNQEDVGHDAHRPNVTGFGVTLFEHFGGHVKGCANNPVQRCVVLFVVSGCQAKVDQLNVIVMEQEILGLEVTVDNVLVVQVGDGIQHGIQHTGGVGFRKECLLDTRSSFHLTNDAIVQFTSHTQFGDNVEVRFVFKGIDERYDATMRTDVLQEFDFLSDLFEGLTRFEDRFDGKGLTGRSLNAFADLSELALSDDGGKNLVVCVDAFRFYCVHWVR